MNGRGDGVSEIERDMAALVNVRLDEEQQEWVRVDDNGVLDLPISVIRQLSDWLKRYDMRPKAASKPGRAVLRITNDSGKQ